MLLQLAIENFTSFRERQVFSLLADPAAGHPPGLVTQLPVGPVLRAAALYGANASGKSNFVTAWRTLRRLVSRGVRPDQPMPYQPHYFEPEGTPTTLSFEAWLQDTQWSYGITYDEEIVREEWLVRQHDGTPQVWFRREEQADGPRVEWGAAVPDDRRAFLAFVAEGTRSEQLLLTELRERDVSELAAVFGFVSQRLHFDEVMPEMELLWNERHVLPELTAIQEVLTDPHATEDLRERLRVMGTGIADIRVIRPPPGRPLNVLTLGQMLMDGEIRMEFAHDDGRGERRWFQWDDLSTGTQRLLAEHYLRGLPVQIMDELGRSLHTSACRALVERHLASGTGQLIFTTHDTNLLDSRLLTPDAVWFVRKDEGAASALYSLLEFDAADLDTLRDQGGLEEAYLEGRFGAVPFATAGGHTQARWTRTSNG